MAVHGQRFRSTKKKEVGGRLSERNLSRWISVATCLVFLLFPTCAATLCTQVIGINDVTSHTGLIMKLATLPST